MNQNGQNSGAGKWTVKTSDAEAAVWLQDGHLLWSVTGALPGMDITSGNLGDVVVDGQKPHWTEIVSAREEPYRGSGKTLTITLKDQTGLLQLTRAVCVLAGHPFVRTWGELKNLGKTPVAVTGCTILDITPKSLLPLALFHVEQFSAKYRRDFFTQNETRLIAGRAAHEIRMGSYPSQHWQPTSCAWFALLSDQTGWYDDPPEKGDGLVCGIEFNGKSRVRAWADASDAHITSTIDDLCHRLSPEGVFEVPAFFAGRFHGDWDEAGYATQQFAEAHIHPPVPDDRYPWVQYNSWAYDQDINEEQQLQAIDRCAELGIELVVLDLGWARAIGGWRPDPVKFPRGLKPLVERAKSYGMRFGVHVALAQCNAEAPVAKEHPEWLIHDQIDYFGAVPLCLGHAPCREWLTGQLSRLIEQEGIEYIVQDGEDMVKSCKRTDHTHLPEDSNYSNSQYGLDLVIASLRKAHPRLVVENCEDGGCMMTYKMAGLYHTSITVDNIDTYSTRQGIYGASYVFSPRYNVRYMQDAPTRYTLWSSIFGGPLIFMHRVTEWSSAEVAETKNAITEYKKLREIIRGAKIYHLKAPKNNTPDGGWGWDAIQAVTADKSQSVVMVYRANGDCRERNIRPGGLLQGQTYSVELVDSGVTMRCTGEELMADGIVLALNENSAEMILLKQLS